MEHSILFRCDGSRTIGFGHIVRCLAIADELKDNHNCKVTFAVLRDASGIEYIRKQGYTVETKDPTGESFNYSDWIREVMQRNRPQAIVFDVTDKLPLTLMNELKGDSVLTITIDDPTEKRLMTDLAFYPPVPQVEHMGWTGFAGNLYVGWEWVVLRRQFARYREAPSLGKGVYVPAGKKKLPKVLVTMGGSDPVGMTLQAIRALNTIKRELKVCIVLGPEFGYKEQLNQLLEGFPHQYDIVYNVSDMATLMASADMAVASFGVTAYELAAMGVPAIYLCFTEDHVESASVFEKNGMAISLGLFNRVTEPVLAENIQNILGDDRLCENIAKQSVGLVDGRGGIRVAEKIITELVRDTR